QTETEATGAPQKHHYTLNQQVGSITITGNLIKVLVYYNLCAAIICCGIKHFKLIPCELFFHMPDNLFQQAAVIYLPQFSDEFHLVCRFVHV
ncbi:hypothetical protein, partial [Klebsiella pneumoniae]|uniref:hypothetical protein n=1 Tax=Klebsiella pneumoniae TaxID=573 RepID=UPI003D31B5E4